MSAQLRSAQRQHDNACDCCGPASIELDDAEISNLLAQAGVEDSLLEAAIFACRNDDFGYLQQQYARLAGPVIEAAR